MGVETYVCVVKCSGGVEASVCVVKCSEGGGGVCMRDGVEKLDKHICAYPYLACHIHSNATNQKRKFTLEKS